MTGRGCNVDGCDSPHHAYGFCSPHACRFAKHGDPLGGGTSKGATRRWMAEMLADGDPTLCWEWPFARTPLGYGVLSWEGKRASAHRVVKSLSGVEVPADSTLCHNCDNPPCVNPAHTYVGTMATNARDRIERGRWGGPTKLTAHQAGEIRRRRAAGERGIDLAAEFEVSPQLVALINRGSRWANMARN